MAGETVLVVEDTEALRRVYVDKLKQDGYDAISAADGLEALAVLKTHDVDLILLDLVMPRMSGLEVLDVVKTDPRTSAIPVVVLSNLGQEAEVQKVIQLGAADYLVKSEARPADVSAKIGALFAMKPEQPVVEGGADAPAAGSYRVYIRDHEGDVESIISSRALPRRLWCPVCEVELALELSSRPEKPGWFVAHLECPSCNRTY